ncbi:MAG: hypothetical protein ACFFD4_23075 [Candidatus Odinarchaeota archaeon]
MTALTIKDVFNKERDPLRSLNTIIQVIDSSEKSVWVEFEEFVLTDTLLKYLAGFAKDVSSSVIFDEPKRPVWLEGFYGSGKSHFAKIIGLLLNNVQLKSPANEAHQAIDFFVSRTLEEHRPADRAVQKPKEELAENLRLFPKKFNCGTLFINLAKYSKSESTVEEHLQSFSTAALKEFNAFLGLSDEIYMAEVEKTLISEGLYDQFRAEVSSSTGKEWEDIRKSTPRARKTFIQVYTKLSNVSETIAENYMKGAEDDVKQKNIDKVLTEINGWAKEHLSDSARGITAKVLLVFDEAGTFFSAAESRIGELQSAAEWVTNPQNQSHVNMIFTAQQSLRKHLEKAKTLSDFHKTEQRFQNWFLGKENIKTVVINRWLKKDTAGEGKQLRSMIESNYPLLIDGTLFETIVDPEMDYQKPERDAIFHSYPFLPYQFPMMIKITQGLIDRQIVREEYGGKTRSILSMTRDVLENKSPYTGNVNFITDPFGTFVNLAQIYDSIIYTLRRKEEDQTTLVEKTAHLLEDPGEFTDEERTLPVTFHHVAKAIFLLDFIDEIYSDENNISKALFHSVTVKKTLYYEKVKKLVDVLKKNGYVNYKKRELTDKKGNKRDIWEYKIATEEEKRFTDHSRGIPVGDADIDKTFMELFDPKEDIEKKFIQKNKSLNITKLTGAAKEEIKLSESVKLDLKWYFDPAIDDELTGEVESSAQNEATVIVLTYRRIKSYDPEQLKSKLILLSKKAFRKQKYLLIIYSSLNVTKEQIQLVDRKITENLKQIYRIKKGIADYPGYTAVLIPTFNQVLRDLRNDVMGTVEKNLSEGFILSGDGELTKVNTSKLNDQIRDILTDIYSKINRYSYLGQIKVSSGDIKTVLAWDPKKKPKIPKYLTFSKKGNGENILLFDEKQDLKPNLAEQYAHIQREFTKKTGNDLDIQVPGEDLLEIFLNPPYSWKENVIILVISAIVRNAEWDVMKNNVLRNFDEEDVIEAFTRTFSPLKFKIAEKLTQADLINAAQYLNDVFNKNVSSPGYETVDQGIREVFTEFIQVIAGGLPKFEQLAIKNDFITHLKYLNNYTAQVLDKKRQIERIKGFLEFTKVSLAGEKKDSFNELRSILYRVNDLTDSGKISRYQHLKKFLEETFRDFSQTDRRKITDELLNTRVELLQNMREPVIFFEQEWEKLWNDSKKLWLIYWDSYNDLHKKLLEDIKAGLEKLKSHVNCKSLSKSQIGELEDLFSCTKNVTIPDTIQNDIFSCSSCNQSHAVLKVIENGIKVKIEELLEYLEKPPVTPPPPSGEKEAWNEYRRYHGKVGALLVKITNLPKMYGNVENIDKMIKESLVPVLDKHKSFEKDHSCSDKPESWKIVAQSCKDCHITYDGLIDLFSDLEDTYNNLLRDINARIVLKFPYEIQRKIAISDEEFGIENLVEEMSRNLLNFIQNKLSTPEYKSKTFSITFTVDKEE